uniref:Uncharacterized protein n=2 Tax=Schistocephalus solidus TaxID=70667 RepID=A0A0X3PPD1_SCHSO
MPDLSMFFLNSSRYPFLVYRIFSTGLSICHFASFSKLKQCLGYSSQKCIKYFDINPISSADVLRCTFCTSRNGKQGRPEITPSSRRPNYHLAIYCKITTVWSTDRLYAS